jgi:xylulokinase
VTLLLGVDIGTSGSKGVLAAEDGSIVATAQRSHAVSMPHPGWAEHDAEASWWGDFVSICEELVTPVRRPAAVAVSGIGPCLLAAGADGAALRPAILYGVDTRATEEIVELETELGADAILARCGSRLSSQAVGPKLLWLARREPQTWGATRMFLMASSFIVHRLTGEYVLDHHSASQCDPLYDIEQSAWIPEWADRCAPGLALPHLYWPGEQAGSVTAAAAAATGLAEGTPVATGTVDAWAEALSVGVSRPGETMLMYGTTFFIVSYVDRPHRAASLWTTAGIDAGSHCLAAGLATGGALAAWWQETTGAPFEDLLADATAAGAGAGGLVALPYFAGERTPIFDPAARGLVLGLTQRHGRGHVMRALLEAGGFAVLHNVDAMRKAGVAVDRLVAVGGATRGDTWAQVVSDVTGLPQDLPRETVGAAYGDALLAARCGGAVAADARWNSPSRTIEPNSRHRGLYEELGEVYLDLYPATRNAAHRLAAIQQELD